MPKGATINKQTKELVQEAIDNLRADLTKNENNTALVRRHYREISRYLKTYGHLGVR